MIDHLLVARLATLAPNAYPMAAPKNYAQPCVIYDLVHVDPVRSLDSGASDWAHMIYRIDVYSESYQSAHTLASAIRDDLVQWTSAEVQSVAWTGTKQMIDDSTEVALFRAMMTFLVFASV